MSTIFLPIETNCCDAKINSCNLSVLTPINLPDTANSPVMLPSPLLRVLIALLALRDLLVKLIVDFETSSVALLASFVTLAYSVI